MNFDKLVQEIEDALVASALPRFGPAEAWKVAVVRLVVAAVKNQGLGGLAAARRAIFAQNVELFPSAWVDPRTMSDFVAHLQSAEAARWAEAEALVVDVERTLVTIVAALDGLLEDGPS